MEDKHIKVKEYLLNLLETGQMKAGDRLPGARRLTEDAGASYTHIQTVIECLVQSGIFETVPRSGTFVQEDWKQRLLPATFYSCLNQPWLVDLENFFRNNLPQIHLCRKFQKGVFELQVTHYLLSHNDEYLDLLPLFKECFPNRQDEFFLKTLTPFIVDGRLCGIPWIFSPRVMIFNRRLFRQAGCAMPHDAWSWDDFLNTVESLKQILPPHLIFYWGHQLHFWINAVVRCGGSLFDPASDDPVRIDSPSTIRGLELYADLRGRLFGCGKEPRICQQNFMDEFAAGKAAMLFAPRQDIYRLRLRKLSPALELGAVAIPTPSAGSSASMMASDLFCIRKSCTDLHLAREILKLMFSEPVQDHFGKLGYGIPFRRSSAQKSLNLEDELDVKYLTEIPRMQMDYNIFSAELYELVVDGIGALCLLPPREIPAEAHRLADAIRLFLKIKKARECQRRWLDGTSEPQINRHLSA